MIKMSWRKNITLGLLIPFAFFGLEGKVEKNYQVETRDELKIEKTISGLESKVFALPKIELTEEAIAAEFKKARDEHDAYYFDLYNYYFSSLYRTERSEFALYFVGIGEFLSIRSYEKLPIFVKVPVYDQNKNKVGERWMVKLNEFSNNEIKKYISEDSLLVEAVPFLASSLYYLPELTYYYGVFRIASANIAKGYSRAMEAVYMPLKRNKINSSIIRNFEVLIFDNQELKNFLNVMRIQEPNVEELHWRNYLLFLGNKELAKNYFNLTLENVNSPVSSFGKMEKIYGYLSPKLVSILNNLTNFSVFEPNARWTYDKYDQFYSKLRSKNKDLETMIDQWIDKEISIYGTNLNQTQIQNIKNNMKVAIAVYNDKMNQFAEDSLKKLTNFASEFYVKTIDTHTGIKYEPGLPGATPLLSFFKQYFTAFNHIIVNSGYSEELRKKYNLSGAITFEVLGFWFDAEEFYKTKYLPTLEKVMRSNPVISLEPYYFTGSEELNKLWYEHYKPFYERYVKYLDVYKLAEQKVR